MDYTLRQIKDNGREINTSLGDWYEVVHIEKAEDVFKLWHKEVFDEEYDKEKSKCFAFVYYKNSRHAIYLGDVNYIMNENGKTFANISF